MTKQGNRHPGPPLQIDVSMAAARQGAGGGEPLSVWWIPLLCFTDDQEETPNRSSDGKSGVRHSLPPDRQTATALDV